MYYRVFYGVLFIGLFQPVAGAGEAPRVPFFDGRWQGGIETLLSSSDFEGCYASTTFADGTRLTLTKRKHGIWYLQLSNPGWRLPHSHRYEMTALVDFYPRVHLSAEAKTSTLLEIADLDHISLLGFIENGHTIDLASDGFNEKYELEGSAKVIERIRNCFTDQSTVGGTATSGGTEK
jgi:hypothetical protein